MDLVVGQTKGFTVQATNSQGQPVPDNNISATPADATLISVTVNPDGSNGQVTALAVGSTTFSATDGTIVSDPDSVNVTQNLVVAKLAIVETP